MTTRNNKFSTVDGTAGGPDRALVVGRLICGELVIYPPTDDVARGVDRAVDMFYTSRAI